MPIAGVIVALSCHLVFLVGNLKENLGKDGFEDNEKRHFHSFKDIWIMSPSISNDNFIIVPQNSIFMNSTSPQFPTTAILRQGLEGGTGVKEFLKKLIQHGLSTQGMK